MTSRTVEMLVAVSRDGPRSLRVQIEDQLRAAIRDGRLRRKALVPSTRDLAQQLGVSRPVVVEAYAQLAAEGYLVLRQGARPRVAECVGPCRTPAPVKAPAVQQPRWDFRPGVPDLAAFPRSAWLRALREALASMRDADFGYTDPQGSEVLRQALADYLGRVRGVVADSASIIVTSGFYQGRVLLCRALAAQGARRVAVEDPSLSEVWESVTRAGLELVPIPVDEGGIRVDALAKAAPDAVVITPAHQYPTGVVMSGERRAALIAWLRERGTLAIEDDYDAEYRYDRAPVGALQPLEPARIVYAGTTSKTLAPALRLGWLVVPPSLRESLKQQQRLVDFGAPRIEQHAFAAFLMNGDLDRHLRRMRGRYRARRDVLVASMREALPEAEVGGVAAGLHATVRLPAGQDEKAVQQQALRRGVALTRLGDYFISRRAGPPTLLFGYARSSEPTIRAGVRELAAVVRRLRGG